MKVAVGWVLLAVLICLVASSLVATSRRVRRRSFFAIVGLGVLVALYGWVAIVFEHQQALGQLTKWLARGAAGEPPTILGGYFGHLELPLSLVVGGSLCFGIFTFDKGFTRQQLRRWVYPGFAWYFAGWVGVAGGVELMLNLGTYTASEGKGVVILVFSVDIRYFFLAHGADLLLLLAFATSALFGFNRKVFQAVFPLVSVLFFASLIFDHWRRPRPWEEIFLWNVWRAFLLMSYFYLNAKWHERHIRSPLIKRIPKAGIFMVAVGVLHEFPEYDRFRKLLPLTSIVA